MLHIALLTCLCLGSLQDERVDAVDALVRAGRFQTELPTADDAPGESASDESRGRAPGRAQRRLPASRRWSWSGPPAGLIEIVNIVFWGLVIGGLLVGLVWAVVQVRQTRREKAGFVRARQATSGNPPVPAPEASDPLALARDLQQQGLFGEAVHALLIAALRALAARPDTPLPDSWTAREVLRRIRDLRAAAPFERLMVVVERYLFAGGRVGASDFETAWRDYEEFTLTLGSGS